MKRFFIWLVNRVLGWRRVSARKPLRVEFETTLTWERHLPLEETDPFVGKRVRVTVTEILKGEEK
jgi:hypothetical protein